MQLFLLQIVGVNPPYPVARFPGGGLLEVELRSALRAALAKRGVGLMHTEAHVLADFDAAFEEVVGGLKRDSKYATGF